MGWTHAPGPFGIYSINIYGYIFVLLENTNIMDTFFCFIAVLLYIEYPFHVSSVLLYIEYPCFIILVSNMFYVLYWCPACFIILMSAVQSLLTYNVFSRKLVRFIEQSDQPK